MPDLICKVRYFRMGKSAPKNSCFKGTVTSASIFGGSSSYFDYCGRYAKEHELSLMDYTGRYGYTMSENGFLDSDEKKNGFKEKGIEALNREGAAVYEIVVSMKDYQTADGYSLVNQDQFSAVSLKIMPSFLRSIGLDPDNVSWWEDFHPENRTSVVPHPHMHLLFFEKQPSHTFDASYGKLPKKAINSFKRMFANEMVKRQDNGMYQKMFEDISLSRAGLIADLKHMNLDRVRSIRDLYTILPKTGRLQINSANIAPYRGAVYSVVDRLLESKDCDSQWRNFLDSLDRYEDVINSLNSASVSSRKDMEIAKVKEQIANFILSEKKNYLKRNSYELLMENRNHSAEEGDSGRFYRDGEIVRHRLSTRNSGASIRKGINGMLAKRQREIEKEIEQYLEGSYSMNQ